MQFSVPRNDSSGMQWFAGFLLYPCHTAKRTCSLHFSFPAIIYTLCVRVALYILSLFHMHSICVKAASLYQILYVLRLVFPPPPQGSSLYQILYVLRLVSPPPPPPPRKQSISDSICVKQSISDSICVKTCIPPNRWRRQRCWWLTPEERVWTTKSE